MARRVALAVVTVLAIAATAGHLRVAGQDWSYAGPALILDHLFSVLLVLAVLAVAYGLGWMILSRLGFDLGSRLDELLYSAALGLGLLATGVLIIGLLRLFDVVALAAFLLICAGLARRQIWHLPTRVAEAARELGDALREDRWLTMVAIGVFVIAGVFLLIMAVAPPVDWDSQMYHLYVPAEFLDAGRIFLPPDNLHTAYVGLFHMIYALFLAFAAPSGAAVLSAVVALLLALTLFSFGARIMDRRTGSVALAAVWGTTTILLVAITPRIDVSVAWFLFLAQYGLMTALEASDWKKYLGLSAVLLGFALGAKYTAIPYIVGLAPLILWVAIKRASRTAAGLQALATFAALFALAVTPWLIKNLMLLGAPFYPFLAHRVLEPWLATLYGSNAVPADVNPAIFRVLGSARQPFNIIDAFFSPGRITIEFEGIFHYTSPLLLLLPLWAFFWKDRRINWLVIPALVYLVMVLVPFRMTNLRYLIPAVPALTLAAAFLLVRISERFFSRSAARVLMLAVLALTLISSSRAVYTWLRYTQALPHLVGAVSGADYVAHYLDPSVRTLSSVINFANRETPPDSKVLMLYESRALYFDRRVIQDTRVVNWPLVEHKIEPGGCLEETGITHVLISLGAIRYYISRGNDPSLFKWQDFVAFTDRCLGGEPIYQDPAFLLFRVDERAGL